MFFKFTTAGESHGKALVAIVEGLPCRHCRSMSTLINHELWRRQQGYGRGGRMKIETDTVEILSGVRHGKTLGSPDRVDDREPGLRSLAGRDVAIGSLTHEPKNPRLVNTPASGPCRSRRRTEIRRRAICAIFSNVLRHAKQPPASPAERSPNSCSPFRCRDQKPRHQTRERSRNSA